MFPSTIAQTIAATNITNGAGRPISQAHYYQKEKEAQIIRVLSDQSRVQVSLPGLQPNFQNLGAALNQCCDDMYYQFRSFKFHNRFYNIAPGDDLEIRAQIFVTNLNYISGQTVSSTENLENNDSVLDGVVPLYSKLYPLRIPLNPELYDPSSNDWETCSGSEIANRLNVSVRKILCKCMAQNNGSPIVDMYPDLSNRPDDLEIVMNIWHPALEVLAQGIFVYDNDTRKFGFNLTGLQFAQQQYVIDFHYKRNNIRTPYLAYYDQNNFTQTSQTRKIIKEMRLWISPAQTLSSASRARLTYCLGMGSIMEYPPNWGEQGVMSGQLCYWDLTDTYFVYMRSIGKKGPLLASFPYTNTKLDLLYSIYRYFDYPAKAQFHDRLYIRTSLRTQFVDEAGRRSDILQIVPCEGLQSNTHIDYEPHHTGGRDYNAKDTLASLKSFYISITDEDGEPIRFPSPWELQIAIFFIPPDPAITTY